MLRIVPSLLLMSMSLAVPLAASAQQAEDPRLAQARAHFAAGEDEFNRALFAACARSFAEVHRILTEVGHPRAFLSLYNQARCNEDAGAFERAADIYERYLRDGGRTQDNAADAEVRIRDLRERRALAGSTPSSSRGSGEGALSPVGPIVLGTGGAAIVVGLIVGGLGLAEGDAIAAECPERVGCAQSLQDRYESMRTLVGAADVLWIAGAVVAATGLVLTLTLRESASVSASAMCTESGCGVLLQGRL